MHLSRRVHGLGVFTLLALAMVLGIGGCGGSSGGDDTRTAFVEVTSSPSGLPVTIQLNNTQGNATTPVAQNMRYDAVCQPNVITIPNPECILVGSAEVAASDRNRVLALTLCVTDGGKRDCGNSNSFFVSVALSFKP